MKYLECANIQIPLVMVESISWQKTAKIITHTGGYISSRGFESAEISVKLLYNFATLQSLGLDAQAEYNKLKSLVTDRLSESGVFYIDGYPIYPELEFTPTNINKTFSTDNSIKSDIIEIDIVFSGVKAVKEVFTQRVLQIEPAAVIPEIQIGVDDNLITVQDNYTITEFNTTPDSVTISMEIGDDMSVLNRDAFLTQLLKDGVIIADLPTGKTKYYVITADLTETALSLVGSILPPASQQMVCKTYQNSTLKSIIQDLCKIAGIECNCICDGSIDYYRSFGAPIQCIRDLQSSAGFMMSWKQNTLTCVFVPQEITGQTEINYITMNQDMGSEPVTGVYWNDGINKYTSGNIDNNSIKIDSVFRSTQDYSKRCLDYERYVRNVISISSDIQQNIDSHSQVTIASNNQNIDCMVEWIENDWINNTSQMELHFI